MKKRERGTARETGGRILCKAKKKKREREQTIAPTKTFKASMRVCESSVSRAAHTQDHMASQSTPPPSTSLYSTKQVLSPEQPNMKQHPPPPNHCAPLLQLSTKRLPGQQSRLNGFIKSSSASIYCLTRACVNTVLDCPDLQYITTSQCYPGLSEV